jgi:hypothetical protein
MFADGTERQIKSAERAWCRRYVLFVFYSFWWPQIVRNATHDLRRPLQPQYILGMTATRLAIPLYIYGCPHNFLRQAPDHTFCIYLVAYVTFQVRGSGDRGQGCAAALPSHPATSAVGWVHAL